MTGENKKGSILYEFQNLKFNKSKTVPITSAKPKPSVIQISILKIEN